MNPRARARIETLSFPITTERLNAYMQYIETHLGRDNAKRCKNSIKRFAGVYSTATSVAKRLRAGTWCE